MEGDLLTFGSPEVPCNHHPCTFCEQNICLQSICIFLRSLCCNRTAMPVVTIRLFHVIIHTIDALVTCHLTNVWPSRTLFRVINLIVLWKFDLKRYQGFGHTPNTHSHRSWLWLKILIMQIFIIPIQDFVRSSMFHLCFIVVISRTKIAIEYSSINLVLYSYTPNEELDSWQIVCAHLTSFLEPQDLEPPSIVGLSWHQCKATTLLVDQAVPDNKCCSQEQQLW